MSVLSVFRSFYHCDGLQVAVGNTRNLRRYCRGRGRTLTTAEKATRPLTLLTAPPRIGFASYTYLPRGGYAPTFGQLRTTFRFSTVGDETKDKNSTIGDGDDDVTSQILYQQFKDLSQEIRKHDELYYSGVGEGSTAGDTGETISDDEFDALVRREEELERNHPELLRTWQLESGLGRAATRSGRVGTMLEESSGQSTRLKRKHLTPMLSLDNVHSEEQLMGWLKRVVKATNEIEGEPSMVTIVTEPKLDGLSLSLRYEASSIREESQRDGDVTLDLKWASTRGDGAIGQDVTAAIKQMNSIPKRIVLTLPHVLASSLESNSEDAATGMALEVRGEVVLPRSEFLRMRQAEAVQQAIELEEGTKENLDDTEASEATPSAKFSFSNPRNAASGILLRKESDDPEEQSQSNELRSLLRFYAYDLSGVERLEENRKADDTKEMDGTQIRELLSDWDFSLALPVEITNIEWSDHDSTTSAKSWDGWFEDTIAKDQIQPIMNYFSALKRHRENLQQVDEKLQRSESELSSAKPTNATTTELDNASERPAYEWGDFDVDGCVHKATQASIRSAMGYSMKSPKWATAHKFPAQSAVSRLLDIIVQVGRTGALTPVAVLEPTEVGGVTVQRATLHNFGHLQDILGSGNGRNTPEVESHDEKEPKNGLWIPKYEPVLLQRAGDVIPQVVRRIQSHSGASITEEDSNTTWISLDPPTKCPSCESPISYETSRSSSSVGQVIRCSGPPLLCKPRAVTSLKHAFSRDALDLTGLSEARIQQLMDADLLRYPSDIFRMGDTEWQSIAALPGWGERSCKNLKTSSKSVASKGITLGRFIYSLGIRHLGKHTSDLVASSYGSVGAFLQALDSAARHQGIEPVTVSSDESKNELQGEDGNELSPPSAQRSLHPFPELETKLGIGPVAVDSLLEFAKASELTTAAKTLAESLNVLEQDVSTELDDPSETDPADQGSRPWKGFRVVFTGSLGEKLTRSKAQEIAKKLGAKATPGSVSKSTDLVVFGEKGGKKLTQAHELGISTMEAEDFVRLANENGFIDTDD